ncbi:hypothetical protein PCANB_001216 [Pneumocystis canis]|nr:hypothetical protein PCK1_001177 [Pneumocystis canis]KAG5437095.1 hypothetical protein PCANB_001216 [Pneumocystis canis]
MPYLSSSALFEKDRISQTHVPRFLKPWSSRHSDTSIQCFQICDKTSDLTIVKHNWELSNLNKKISSDSFGHLEAAPKALTCPQIVPDRFDKLYASSPMPKLVNEAYFRLSNSFPHGEVATGSSGVLKTTSFSLNISESLVQNSCHMLQQNKIMNNDGFPEKCIRGSVFSSELKKYDDSKLRKRYLKPMSQNMLNLKKRSFNDQLNSSIKHDYLPVVKKVNVKRIDTLVSKKSNKNNCANGSLECSTGADKIQYSFPKEISDKSCFSVKDESHVFFSGSSGSDVQIQRLCITDGRKSMSVSSGSNNLSFEDISVDNKDKKINEIYLKNKNKKTFDKPFARKTRFSLTENELKNLSIFGGYISEEKLKRKRHPPRKWWLVSSNRSYESLEKGNASLTVGKKKRGYSSCSVKNKNDKCFSASTSKLIGTHIYETYAFAKNKQGNSKATAMNVYEFSD